MGLSALHVDDPIFALFWPFGADSLCKESVYDFKENAAGGGLKLLALSTAVTCLIAAMMSSVPTHAADQSYSLYYINSQLQVEEIKDTQFKQIGRYAGGVPCAVTTDNKVWTQLVNDDKPVFRAGFNASSCTPDTNRNYYIPFHSNLWSGGFYRSDKITDGVYLGIDADGYLWMTNQPVTVYPGGSETPDYGDTPIRLGVKFFDGVTNGGGDETGSVLLLGQNRAQSNTTVAQMPTSGAPTGLSTVGIMAVLTAMVGLMFMGFRMRLRR